MKLLVFGLEEALEYEPVDETYAIRIASSWVSIRDFGRLRSSPLYVVKEYVFDDVKPGFGKGKDDILIGEDIARRVLEDFKTEGLTRETLLVHCIGGRNRSPAVALALGEIFRLGYDTEELRRKYPLLVLNQHICRTLKETAAKLGISAPTS